MKPVFDEPVFQELYEREHPFFVAWAWARQQDRADLEIIYANEQNNHQGAEKRRKEIEQFADNLIEQFAKLGQDTTALRGQLAKLKNQPLVALEKANETRAVQAKLRHAQWQALADEVWKANPHWNKDGVARQIIEDNGINAKPGTVADILKKPKSD